MKRVVIVLVVLLACVAGLGFYQGWWHFSVDQEQIQSDREKYLGGKGKEPTGGPADKAGEPQRRP